MMVRGPYVDGDDDDEITLEEIAEEIGVSVEYLESLFHDDRECLDCGHEWEYTGDFDRPTCPQCKGKNTRSLLEDGA